MKNIISAKRLGKKQLLSGLDYCFTVSNWIFTPKAVVITVMAMLFINTELCSGLEAESVDIHGFMSQGYIQTSKYNYGNAKTDSGTFEFNEMGLSFMSSLSDDLNFGLQFFSYDFGSNGNNQFRLDWAYADYNLNKWFGARIGKLKVPLGLYNESRDIDSSRSTIFLPSVYANGAFRHLFVGVNGGLIYGLLPSGLSYQFQAGQIDDQKIKDYGYEDKGHTLSDVSMENVIATQLQWETPLDGLLIALSSWQLNGLATKREGTASPMGDGGFRRAGEATFVSSSFKKLDQYVFSAEYTHNNFMAVFELNRTETDIYIKGIYQLDNSSYFNRHVDVSNYGYYLTTSYRLLDWFETAITFSESYLDKDSRDNPEEYMKDYFATLLFDITDSWLIKVEAHKMNGLMRPLDTGEERDDHLSAASTADPGWFMYAVKSSIAF
jgi:hypothetical protein